MKAVISVIGRDTVGILAAVAGECAKHNINVTDVTQSVLQDMFVMVMLIDISGMSIPLTELADSLDKLGNEKNLKISVMHEDIFSAMHNI